MNKTILMGRLGHDPEMKALGGDNTVTNFSVATSRKYFSKKENKQAEDTQWHKCSAFGKTGDNIAKYLKKGDPILLEGRIEYRQYDKDGVTMWATNILVDRFEFVSGRVGQPDDAKAAESQQTDGQALKNHAPQTAAEAPGYNYSEPTPF